MKTAPVIFGCAGLHLSEAEHDFFARLQPCGFILFARNIEDPDQLSRLVGELKACVEAEPLILIDQEGGRVARLKPPPWPLYRPWRDFGDLARHDEEAGARAAYLNARLIGDDLAQLGITVDCLPVLDVPVPGAHDIIGDRAFAEEPETVMQIGRKVCEGLMDSGVLPTIKHIPGHGRAGVDSHEALPRVTESREVLEKTDFAPFAALCDMPIAMTAHIVFEALDPAQPVTTSSTMIDLIRKDIGFDGLLLSDDLGMKALKGDFASKARDSLAAGCDIALHCSGDMAEMQQVAEGLSPMGRETARRLEEAHALLHPARSLDRQAAEAERDRLLGLLND